MARCTSFLGAAVILCAASAWADVTITVDPGTQYQTIQGWGAMANGEDIPQYLREQVIDTAVNDYGLTRLRLEPPGGNGPGKTRWEWLNDNGDPDAINWAALNTAACDRKVTDWVLPFKQKVEANGDPFSLYVSPSFFDGGSSGTAPTWLINSPGEYAEFAASLLLRLKNVHGITADYYCIMNEAGNNNSWSASVVGRMIRTLGPKLQGLGLSTKIQFPECMNADGTWSYIQALQGDPDIWPYVGLISYHLYGSNTRRPDIYSFALSKGLPTAMTEYMNETTQHLYEDLTLGGVSFWETYGYNGRGYNEISYNNDLTQITALTGEYWWLRQTMHYVRPGAVRIGCTPSNTALRAVAFSQGGKAVVVLNNNVAPMLATQNAVISGLPAGQYCVSQTYGGTVVYQELGVRTVAQDGTLTVSLLNNSVLTVYPYPGTNLPPVVKSWNSSPNYLTVPASTTTLSALAYDPELAAISYTWSIVSQPAGASVSLATPNAASCAASGLGVVGTYTFRVTIGDGTTTVTRDVTIRVHAGNEPPVHTDVHNRNPVMVFTSGATTQLRSAGYDLEGDALTYLWTVVSQPAGANAVIASPTSSQTNATGLNVAGTYVFRIALSDPTHTVTQDLAVPVYSDPYAPVISSATATPPAVAHAGQTTQLSGTTSDAGGDTLTHWWTVKTAPAGARPVFDTQGHASTNVSGMTVAGTYTFTLSAIDLTHTTTRDVTVTVGQAITGDINIDGGVDVVDLLYMVDTFGLSLGDPGYDARADLNGDTSVDVVDLLILVDNWPTN